MSFFLNYVRNSGLYTTSITRFWAVPFGGGLDPQIPSLPLELLPITAALAVTETSDSVDFAASVSGGTATVSFAITESSDVAAFNASAFHTAALAVTETSDTVAIAASARHTAALAVTETSDTVAIAASAFHTAALAVTETSDTVAFNVTVASSTATVTFAITEPSDTIAFSVLGASSQPISGGGHAWKGPIEPEYRVHPEFADRPKKKRKVTEPETIVLAPDLEVQTGIVPVRPAWDVMVELQQRADEAEQARRDRLRQIALADDEWLMVA